MNEPEWMHEVLALEPGSGLALLAIREARVQKEMERRRDPLWQGAGR